MRRGYRGPRASQSSQPIPTQLHPTGSCLDCRSQPARVPAANCRSLLGTGCRCGGRGDSRSRALRDGDHHLDASGSGHAVPVHSGSDALTLPCPGDGPGPPRARPQPARSGYHVSQEQGHLLLSHGVGIWGQRRPWAAAQPHALPTGLARLSGHVPCSHPGVPWPACSEPCSDGGRGCLPVVGAAASEMAHSGQNHSSTGTSWRGGSKHSMWYLWGQRASQARQRGCQKRGPDAPRTATHLMTDSGPMPTS